MFGSLPSLSSFSPTHAHTVKQDSTHTIGVEFGSKIIDVGGKKIKLQIWDTVRQNFLNKNKNKK